MAAQKQQEFKAWQVNPSASKPAFALNVVWLPQGFKNTPWMKRVSKDSKAKRTIFLQPVDDRFLLSSFGDAERKDTMQEDIAAVSQVLLKNRSLGPESQARLEAGGKLHTVTLKPQEGVNISEDTIRGDKALKERIQSENEKNLKHLERQLRSPLRVIPFVGAGMSKPFGFPEWGDFLRSIAEGTRKVDGLNERVKAGDYESVAEELWKSNPDLFQREIENIYNVPFDAQKLRTGPLALLASLINGPVITTNFDRILEETFAACGKKFKDTIPGPQPDRIRSAIHENKFELLKIHGDYAERTFRTFTTWEYNRSYEGTDGKQITLSRLGWLMFTRPLLFLGSSLEQDRTVKVLQDIHQTLPGMLHYAIIAAHYSDSQLCDRREALSACGISPIWYRPTEYTRIEELLRELLDRAQTKEIYRPLRAKPQALPSDKKAAARFKQVVPASSRRSVNAASSPVVGRMADAILGGRLAFFLGAWAHLDPHLLGTPFYQHLAQKFNAPDPQRHRSEIARYILDRYGQQALWAAYKEYLPSKIKPSLVYQFLAALPGFLRAKGRAADVAFQWILTTNYDTLLEETFEAAGEPFHLFYYMSSGADDGLFAYRLPNGTVRIIEDPENFRQSCEQGSIILKMNGGQVYGKAIPESVMIAQGDFERLAGRLPAALPGLLRQELSARSLLFLGHGLNESDVEALIRSAAAEGVKREAWAVQLHANDDWRDYWAKCHLQIVEFDLKAFIIELHERLAQAL